MSQQESTRREATRVLIVDDEQIIRRIFHIVFASPGYSIMEATTAEAALALANEHMFDVAFMDIRMPGMDGISAAKLLRLSQPNLRIILMSGDMPLDAAEAVKQATADCFLPKPFTLDETMSALQTAFLHTVKEASLSAH